MSMSKPLPTRIPVALATFLLLVAPLAALVVPGVAAQPLVNDPFISVQPAKVVADGPSNAYEFDITITNDWSPAPIGFIDIISTNPSEVLFIGSNNDPGSWESTLVDDDGDFIEEIIRFQTSVEGEWLLPQESSASSVTFTIVAKLTPASDPSTFTVNVKASVALAASFQSVKDTISTTFNLAVESAPTITSAVTVDLDGGASGGPDGRIDAYKVTFSSAVKDDTFEASGWSVAGTTVGAALATPPGDVADDAVVYIPFTPIASTSDKPDLTYSRDTTPTFTGKHGTLVANVVPSAVTETDGAPPALLTAITKEITGDNALDSILLTFSESLDGTLDAADFEVTDDDVATAAFTDADRKVVQLTLDSTNADTLRTDAVPTVTYGGNLADADGNKVTDATGGNPIAWTTMDAAAPVILSAVTVDDQDLSDGIQMDNGDGSLDAYLVTFSEDIAGGATEAGWSVDGSAATGVSITTNAKELLVEFAGLHGTGDKPQLTYTAANGDVEDLAAPTANSLADVAADDVTEADAATPVLVNAFILTGTRDLKAVFSEAVESDSGGALAASAFTYTDHAADGSGNEQSVTPASVTHDPQNNGESATLVFDSADDAFAAADEADGDSLGINPTQILDAAGNNAAGSKVVEEKTLTILSAATVDDGDGHLDAVEVRMSVPVKSDTLDAADWTVGDYTISGIGLSGGGQIITLSLTQKSVGDTGETPTVTYMQPTGTGAVPVRDYDDEVSLDGATIDADDDAPVVFLGAETVDAAEDGTVDFVRVRFSEPLDDAAAPDDTLWTLDNAAIDSMSLSTAGDEVHLVPDGDFGTGFAPVVRYNPGAPGAPGATPLEAADGTSVADTTVSGSTAADAAKPVLVSVTGNPGDGSVLLTFSEPVQGSGSGGSVIPFDLLYADDNEVGASGIGGLSAVSPTQTTMGLNAPLDLADVGSTEPDMLAFKAGKVTDVNGLAAVTTPVAFTDVTAPTVVASESVTEDSNEDGRIDRIHLKFTEVLDDDFDAADFTLGSSYEVDDADTATDVSGDTVTLVLKVETGQLVDTGARPTVTYAAGSLKDSMGNPVDGFTVSPADGAAPVAVYAATVDDNQLSNGIQRVEGDGFLDGYLITFSENVQAVDASGGWSVDGRGNARVQTVPHGLDQIFVRFNAGPTPDTADLPTLDYDEAVGTVTDRSATAHPAPFFNFLAADGRLLDAAAPVLVRVEGQPGDAEVTAVFSEPVDNGAGQDLADEAFTYYAGAVADETRIVSVDHTVPSHLAVLTLDPELMQAELDNDGIAVSGGYVYAGILAAPSDVVLFDDVDEPEVLEVRTADGRDGLADGHLDTIYVVFNEVLDPAGFEYEDFEVTGYDVAGGTLASSSAEIALHLTPKADFDTDTLPVVTYDVTRGTLTDNLLADGSANEWDGVLPADTVDGAPPVIVWARGTVGSPYIDVRFSEPVFADAAATLRLDDAAVFDFTDLDGNVELLDVIDHAPGGTLVRLEADGAIAFGDDEVAVVGTGLVFDANGLEASLTPQELVAYTSGPQVDDILTLDTDGNGILDAVLVTFDVPVGSDGDPLDADAWKVAGMEVSGVSSPDGAVMIDLVEGSNFNTEAVPAVSYVRPAQGAVVDADGVPLASFDGSTAACPGALCTKDGAGPALVQVVGSPGSYEVTLYFSEAVADLLTMMDLTYADGNGDSQIKKILDATVDSPDFDATVKLFDPLGVEAVGVHLVGVKAGLLGVPADNVGMARELPIEDEVEPFVKTVATVDGDGDGLIDALLVTLSEPFLESTLIADGFSIAAPYGSALEALTIDGAANGVQYGAAGPNAFYLAFTQAGDPESGDTGVEPVLTYDGQGTIEDLSGNLLVDTNVPATADGAAPAILSATTVDDGNGILDAYLVTFSEGLDDIGSAADWSVAGFEADGVAAVEVTQMRIVFDGATLADEDVPLGTGDTPQLTYTAPEQGGVADGDGNRLVDLADADVVEEDDAPPVILQVNVQPGSKKAHVLFSEDVHNGAGARLSADQFTYDGSEFTGDVEHVADSAKATLEFDAPIPDSDLGKLVAVTGVFDAVPLEAPTGGVPTEDLTAPSVKTTTTVDDNGDGRIDQIVVEFNENVDFSNFEVADFGVLTYTIASADKDTTSTADRRLALHLQADPSQPFDTGARPTVTYDASLGSIEAPLEDVHTNAWDGTQPAQGTLDGAAPILVSAQVVDASATTVRVRFSEPVSAAKDTVVALGVDQFDYGRGDDDVSNAGADDKGISSVTHVLLKHTVDLIMDKPLDGGDQTAAGSDQDSVAIAMDTIFDRSGNVLDVAFTGVVVGPIVKSITTVDGDGDGLLDALEVVFSTQVTDSAFPVTEWSVAGAAIPAAGVTTGSTAHDDTIRIALTEDTLDTGATPAVGYSGTSIKAKDSGLALLPFADHTPLDGAAPVVLRMETRDLETVRDEEPFVGDGVLDLVQVHLSEPVLFGQTAASEWKAGGSAPSSVVPASPADLVTTDTLELSLAVNLGTGAKPLVSYSGTSLVDAAGNLLAKVTDRVSDDGASPVLLSATSPGLGKTEVTLTFSEAVFGNGEVVSGSAGGKLIAADLKYRDHSGDGAGGFTVASQTDDKVILTLDAALVASDNAADTIAAVAGKVKDAGTNAASAVEVPLTTDIEPPAAVTNVAATSPTGNSVTLTFTAVADDANHAASGPATSYQVRHHSSAITESNWASATPATFSATPGAPGAAESVQVTGLATETAYHFALRAVDDAGNVGGVSNSDSATTLADGTPPSGTLAVSSSTHTSGVASPATSAVLTWGGISDGESSITYRYKVSDQATYTVTSADDAVTGTSITLSSLADGSRYVHLAGFSAGGSRQAAPFQVVTDTVAPAKVTDLAAGDAGPLSITLTWKAPGDDGGSGTAKDYQLYRSESAFIASGLADVPLVSGVVAPAAAGTVQSFEVTGLSPDTEYHFAIRARDDAGNAGALSSVVVTSTDPDTTAPVGELGLRSSSHLAGAKSNLRDLAFGWDAATDAESDVVYRHALVAGAVRDLTDSDPTTDDTSVEFDGVEPGTWTFLVAAESDGGRGATESFQVVLLGLSDEDLEDANKEVAIKVTRKGDTNVVTWTLPAGTPADVEGVQVLRSNSPYRVVATIPADSEEFAQGTFVDDSDDAKATSAYLVTMYYGESDSLGKQPEGQDLLLPEPLTAIGTTPAPQVSASVFGHAAFYLGLLAVLAIVGFAIAAVVMHGQRRPQPAREPTSREASA